MKKFKLLTAFSIPNILTPQESAAACKNLKLQSFSAVLHKQTRRHEGGDTRVYRRRKTQEEQTSRMRGIKQNLRTKTNFWKLASYVNFQHALQKSKMTLQKKLYKHKNKTKPTCLLQKLTFKLYKSPRTCSANDQLG